MHSHHTTQYINALIMLPGRESHGDSLEVNIEIPGYSDKLPMLSKTEEIRVGPYRVETLAF